MIKPTDTMTGPLRTLGDAIAYLDDMAQTRWADTDYQAAMQLVVIALDTGALPDIAAATDGLERYLARALPALIESIVK